MSPARASLEPAALVADLRDRQFALGARAGRRRRRVGLEVELLPIDVRTGRIAAVSPGPAGAGSLVFLRRHAREHGWTEECSSKGAPRFRVRGGGRITFEPGGQLEYSSPPYASASRVLDDVDRVIAPLRRAAAACGIRLEGVGIEAEGGNAEPPLQVPAGRYTKMAAYFAAIGPAGAMMMRQTAAVQVNLDFDDEPLPRWRVLNAAAPCVTAIFANSAVYAGRRTGHKSLRAHVWRELDPCRTGVFAGGDAIGEYASFALHSPAALLPGPGGYRPFLEHARRGAACAADWRDHLSTLFPEVRPRGYLEVRSADAIDPAWYAAPVVLLAGMLYHRPSRAAAAELLGTPNLARLRRAGAVGLQDAALRETAVELFRIALGGAAALGTAFVERRHLDVAREFFERYTLAGRSPADDRLGAFAGAADEAPRPQPARASPAA